MENRKPKSIYMKKLYSLIACAGLTVASSFAQYSTNFDDQIDGTFLEKSVYQAGQNGSDLIIFSQGHDEWDGMGYVLNDGTNTTTTSLSGTDTIYVRAKAVFDGTVNPVLSLKMYDENGVGPNNAAFNAQNGLTLTDEYQVFKVTVPDWNNTYGGGGLTDSTSISKFEFAMNNGFASYPFNNGEGETVNAAFEGTVYIDYISVGSDLTAGTELDVLTAYTSSFDAGTLDDVTAADSYVVDVVDGALEITSAGHDEWEIVNVKVPDAVVDISSGLKLSFTASVEKASGFTGEVGIMVALVDEVGTRIDYDGLYTYQDLSSDGETIVIEFTQYVNQGEFTIQANEGRIASFDILINHGFASFPPTNDAGNSVTAGFEGVLTISEIAFTDEELGLDLFETTASFDVSPNPASDVLNLDVNIAEYNSYSISGLSGTVVAEGVVDSSVLTIGNLDAGVYTLSLIGENGVASTRVIKN